jgi:hypothetical protein
MNMNGTLIMTTLAALWVASAQAVTPDPRLLGTWDVDLSTSAKPANASGPPPRSVTVTYRDARGGKFTEQQTVVLADGREVQSPAHTTGPATADGAPMPVAGDPAVDSVTIVDPDASTVIVTGFKAGKQVIKEIIKLSADNRRMVVDVDGVDMTGNPYHSSAVLNKK